VTINGGEVTVSGYAGAGIGGGYQCGSHGGLQIYDRAKVAAGENEANAALVAPTERVDACRMPYAKIEPCKDHHYEYGYCEFCGDTLPASVANVVARQRWPWNGLVDIEYDVSGDTVGLKAEISFVEQGGEARTWTATRFVDGFAPRAERGHHHAVWDTSSDGATNIVARVKAVVKLRKEN